MDTLEPTFCALSQPQHNTHSFFFFLLDELFYVANKMYHISDGSACSDCYNPPGGAVGRSIRTDYLQLTSQELKFLYSTKDLQVIWCRAGGAGMKRERQTETK